MPLIILGAIVIVGALLLIYYQLGPTITSKLKGANSDFVSRATEWFSGEEPKEKQEPAQCVDIDEREKQPGDAHEDNGKVLFIFGDGEREERPLKGDTKDEVDE